MIIVVLQDAACATVSFFGDRCSYDGALTLLGVVLQYVFVDSLVIKLFKYSESLIEPAFSFILALDFTDGHRIVYQ